MNNIGALPDSWDEEDLLALLNDTEREAQALHVVHPELAVHSLERTLLGPGAREGEGREAKAQRLLAYVIKEENLDLDKVKALIEANVDSLWSEKQGDLLEDQS